MAEFANNERVRAWTLCGVIVGVLLLLWHAATLPPTFDAAGLSDDELMTMEFNGDIVRNEAGSYIYNPDKMQGIPGPGSVAAKAAEPRTVSIAKLSAASSASPSWLPAWASISISRNT